MTGVTTRRWTTAGLAQVTNGEETQALLSRDLCQILEVPNERGMAKKAAPMTPHCLKARSIRR
jgi:hypothetical protein